jgi:hypothetical protein
VACVVHGERFDDVAVGRVAVDDAAAVRPPRRVPTKVGVSVDIRRRRHPRPVSEELDVQPREGERPQSVFSGCPTH